MTTQTAIHHPAIALSTVRHKDGVSILRVFSREHGVVGCLVRQGVKGPRRARHLQAPLALLDLVGMRHMKEELYRFDRADRVMAQDRTTAEVPRSAIAMFLAECVMRTFDSGTAHAEVFDALWAAAERIEREVAIGRLHLAFLVDAVAISGLKPDAPVASSGHGKVQFGHSRLGGGPSHGRRLPFGGRGRGVFAHSRHGF